MEEDVGRRLPILDLVGAEDASLESIQQSGQAEGEGHLLVAPAGGHAHQRAGLLQLCQHLHHAGHGYELTLEHISVA